MSSCTINENLAGLRAEIANAEATQNEAVAIMARQEKVPAELWQRLRATSPGVSDEDLQAKVNRQIADSKDVKCLLEAGRLVAGPLREAQREVNDVAAQFDFVGRGYRAIGERIAAALAEVQQARRARSTDLLCEINRLRSAPNKNEIVGRQRRISELKAHAIRLKCPAAKQATATPSPTAFNGLLSFGDGWRRQRQPHLSFRQSRGCRPNCLRST